MKFNFSKSYNLSRPYIAILIVIFLWDILIFLTPFLESSEQHALYSFFSYFCHQIPLRSLTPYDVTFGVVKNFHTFPVCARDFAFYLFMLIGVVVFPAIRKTNSKEIPNIWWLIIAAVPMAIDGGTQLLGLRESTNLLRVITGAILGFVCAYYLIPLVNIFTDAFKERFTKKEKFTKKSRGYTKIGKKEKKKGLIK